MIWKGIDLSVKIVNKFVTDAWKNAFERHSGGAVFENLNPFVVSFNLSIQKIILNLQHYRGGVTP